VAGPDLVFESPGDELVTESWRSNRSLRRNRRPKLVVPAVREDEWSDFYVRTALVRSSAWRPGSKGPVVTKASEVAEILQYIGGLDHERLLTLALDDKNRLLAIHEASVGGRSASAVLPSDVLRVPLLAGATGVVLAHNHPSGESTPSVDDVMMTRTLSKAARLCGIELLEHVVLVRGADYRSVFEFLPDLDAAERGDHVRQPGADEILRRTGADLAVDPFGKYEKFVVRTAVVEAEEGQGRPRVSMASFVDVLGVPAVQQLRKLISPAVVTLCLNARLDLLAINVRVGEGHAAAVPTVASVAALVPSAGVIVAHNHPNDEGVTAADRVLFDRLGELADVGLPVMDQVLVRRSGYLSLSDALS
jgi:DNA repair protein RadC